MKIESVRPVVIASLWLVGDSRASDFLRAGDRGLAGCPFLITTKGMRPDLKAALVQRLTKGGARIIRAELTPTIIRAVNDGTNRLVQDYLDPALGLKPFAT